MTTLITIVHIIVCLGLIVIVLLQAGKGADLGAAFGGASQTVFGSRGPASFMGKLTTGIAIIFMLTSLSLSFFSGRSTQTVIPETKEEASVEESPTAAPEEALPVPEEETSASEGSSSSE